METEIVEVPLEITLVGLQGDRSGKCAGEVGKALMDPMWQELRERGIANLGINHWVYLPAEQLFVGVELEAGETADLGTLQKLEVALNRYLRYVHRGPYDQLGQVWDQLFAEVQQRGESPVVPHLEIYGHWQPDPAQCETTIFIGLG